MAMTEPQQQPTDSNPPPQVETPPPNDGSSLVPALLIVYGAYLLWRGAHHAVPTGWRQVAAALNLRGLVGAQLALVAARALGEQRAAAGRPGDDLWPSVESGIKAGVDAGLQVLAGALIWSDHQSTGAPATKDSGGVVPTLSNPPELLAQMVTTAVVNAAQVTVAATAGWTMKTWRSREDARVRDTHRSLNGTKLPMDGTFASPSGAKLRFPGDPRAPIAEVANCRCRLVMTRR